MARDVRCQGITAERWHLAEHSMLVSTESLMNCSLYRQRENSDDK